MKNPQQKRSRNPRNENYRNDDVTDESGGVFQLEGRNPVLEALKSDKPVDTLLVKKGDYEGTIRVITAIAREKGILIKEMSREKLDEISQTDNHQGVIALCAVRGYVTVDEILAVAGERGEPPFIVILDGVTDPHNLGAVIRTAEASGAHGIIIPKRRAVGITPVVGKVSAGAIEHVAIARVSNIAQTIDELKKRGLWVYCCDMGGESLFSAGLDGAAALVIGAEGAGVSRLVRDKCDFTLSIPMFGKIGSLNASVAAGLFMYEVVRRRSTEGKA